MKPKRPQIYFVILMMVVMGFLNSLLATEKGQKGQSAASQNYSNQEWNEYPGEEFDIFFYLEDHDPNGFPISVRYTGSVRDFLYTYRGHLRHHSPNNPRLSLSDRGLFIELGLILDKHGSWDAYETQFPGIETAFRKAIAQPEPPISTLPILDYSEVSEKAQKDEEEKRHSEGLTENSEETGFNPTEICLDCIREKAETGDPYFQAYLGIIYRTGYKDVDISLEKARKWTELSASQNHPIGLANLGAIYLYENEDLQDINSQNKRSSEAIELYEEAYFLGLARLANSGDPLAADLMADYYILSSPPTPEKAIKFWHIAIEKGFYRSNAALGFFKMTGFGGVEMDKKEGVKLLKQAADHNLPEGLYNLATAYLKGDGVELDQDKAISLVQEAARRGHREARKALKKIEAEEGKAKGKESLETVDQLLKEIKN